MRLGLVAAVALAAGCAPERPAHYRGASAPSTRAAAPETERRLLVALAEGQTPGDLERVASATFATGARVEPLFPTARSGDDPQGLATIHVVHLDGPVPGNAWDEAHALRDAGGFRRVEPDLHDTLEAPTRRAAGACLGDDGVPAPAESGWSLREMNAPAAWALEPGAEGARFGEGVRVCHVDTGWTEHVDIDTDRIDRDRQLDLVDGDTDARDPLDYRGNPGHGMATGSVLFSAGGVDAAGRATPPGYVTGVAPRATIVPIRAIRSVVQFFDSNVAAAVRYATDVGCDVVSMSLGGRAFFGLEKAIEDAVARDVIVVAAAGNCVGVVVAPALYDHALAIAATNAEHRPWRGSSRGSKVAVAAPGEDVYVARCDRPCGSATSTAEPGDGTSFATAEVAGAAALWIAFHGRGALTAAQQGATRQALFAAVLRAASDPPEEWPPSYGAGIVKLDVLLRQPLDRARRTAEARSGARDTAPLDVLSTTTGIPPGELAGLLQRSFAEDDVDVILERWGGELQYLAASRPETAGPALRGMASGGSVREREASESLTTHASSAMARAMERE